MRYARRWRDQPQSVWLRKANFQIHRWAGIGVGLYILVICVTGSALVFRPELTRRFPARSAGFAIVTWLLDLHDNLIAGRTGRYVNGVGGLLLTVLALTGAVIWWPGIKNWRRSLTLHRGVNWKRFTWDLHSTIGFWSFVLTLMWAVSGAYLVFQQWVGDIVDPFQSQSLDDALVWLTRLHFGRFRGLRPNLTLSLKIFWVVAGLAPAALFITGTLMWWNRVVRKAAKATAAD